MIMHTDYFANEGQQQEYLNVGTDVTAGFNTYGFQFIPGQSVTAYFNGRQVWQVLASSGTTITASLRMISNSRWPPGASPTIR